MSLPVGLAPYLVPAVMTLAQKATSVHFDSHGSSSGAKFGPPTPATSSSSNQRIRFRTQPRGGTTSSSVNSVNSVLTLESPLLQASALQRLRSSR